MARKKRSVVTTVAPQTEAKKPERYRDTFQQNVGKKFEEVGKKLEGHKRNLLYGLGALVVLAVIVGIYFAWSSRTNAAAQAALGRAIETSDAAISSNPVPAGSATKQFPSAKERAQAAIPEFQAVIDRYGGAAGERAKYFIAINQMVLDRSVGIQQLEQLAGKDDEVGKLSKFALAQTRVDDNRLDDAVVLYRELAGMSDPIVPKDQVNLELAKIYEKQGKKQEAVDLLFNIVKSASEAKDLEGKPVPLSPAAQDAKEKLANLDPEKAKEIPEATPPPLDLGQ